MRDRLGAPIEYDRKRRGYFYTEPIWSLPAVTIREGELVALLLARQALEQYENFPMGALLNNFYEQVLGFLGHHVGVDSSRILEGFSFLPPPSVPIDPEIWKPLSQCLLKRQAVDLDYQSVAKDEIQTYTIDPLHISNIEGAWYLFGRSHYKGDIIQLALSRMLDVRMSNASFRSLESFDPVDLKKLLFGQYASMQGEIELVKIQVDASYAPELQKKQWHVEQQIEVQDDGSVVISFPVSSGSSRMPYGNVLRWVLGMGSHVRVLAPEPLRKLVAEEIRKMASSLKSKADSF